MLDATVDSNEPLARRVATVSPGRTCDASLIISPDAEVVIE